MLWYIVICVAMLYPVSIVCVGNLSGKKTQEIALISGCMILWFFMAMRATTVGVDTQYYSYVFTQFADIPLSEVFSAVTYATESETWAFDFEPGYRLLNKVVSFFCADPQAITVVNSTIIIILLYRLIRRNSTNFLLSLWLYLTLGIFQTEMNVTRNAIAILLVYNGFAYIQSKDAGKYVICCLAASLFHVASLVFIPIYWLAQIYIPTMKKSIFVIGLFFLIGILFPFISPYIRLVLPDALDKYFMRGNDNLASILVGLFNAGLFMLVFLLLDRKSRDRVFQECSVGIIMLTINMCFFGLNLGLDYAARMAALFGPYIIILIPQMAELIGDKTKKRDVSLLIAFVCGMQYLLRLCINNIGGTVPYEFFW